jgi:hypothetical protein
VLIVFLEKIARRAIVKIPTEMAMMARIATTKGVATQIYLWSPLSKRSVKLRVLYVFQKKWNVPMLPTAWMAGSALKCNPISQFPIVRVHRAQHVHPVPKVRSVRHARSVLPVIVAKSLLLWKTQSLIACLKAGEI